MLKLNVGVNRKVQGDEEFSSKGFSCNLEVELADGLLNDGQALRAKMEELFSEAKAVVDDQINGNGRPNHSQPPKKDARSSTSDNGEAATNKQIQYLLSLSRKNHGMDLKALQAFCNRMVGEADIYALTKVQCSQVIEALKGGNSNGRK